MEITITVNGIESLVEAINRLAGAATGKEVSPQAQMAVVPQQPIAPPAQPPVYQQPQMPAAPVMPQQPQMQQPSLPTSHVPQNYTQDQLAVAATGLMDAGRQADLMRILAGFGAQTLMQVPQEQYPALATALRGAGAAI